MESKPNSKSVKLAVGLAFSLTAAAAVADSGGVKFDTTTLRAFPTNFFSANLTNLTAITFGPTVAGTEPIRIGTNANRSIDALIVMARTVASQPGVAATNSHALTDSTVHTRTNAGYAANSVDIRVRFTNNFSMDHFVGLQFLPDLADGTMTNLWAVYSMPNVRSGTTRTNFGLFAGLSNSGTVPANYGVYIATPTGNAPTLDYGVRVDPRHASASSYLHFWAADDLGRFVIGTNRDVIFSRDRAYTAQLWVDAAAGAGQATELHGTDATGTDLAGGTLTLSGGRNTGAGAPGALVFSTSPYGSTGVASNNLVERMRIDTNAVIIPATVGLRMLGNNISSGYVWTATNATTGEGEWRAAAGGGGSVGPGALDFDLTQFSTNGAVYLRVGALMTNMNFRGSGTNRGDLYVDNAVFAFNLYSDTFTGDFALVSDPTGEIIESQLAVSDLEALPSRQWGSASLTNLSSNPRVATNITVVSPQSDLEWNENGAGTWQLSKGTNFGMLHVTNYARIGNAESGGKLEIYAGVTNATGGITNVGLCLINPNPALVGFQMDSPFVDFLGYGWKTTATAASQSVGMRNYFKPAQGTTTPTGSLLWIPSTNGLLANTAAMSLTTGGALSIPGNLVVSGTITASGGTPGNFIVGGNLTIGNNGIVNAANNGSLSVGATTTPIVSIRSTNLQISSLTFFTNGVVMLTNNPPYLAGVTNGLSMWWNSNGNVFLRTSRVGATNWQDTLQAAAP